MADKKVKNLVSALYEKRSVWQKLRDFVEQDEFSTQRSTVLSEEKVLDAIIDADLATNKVRALNYLSNNINKVQNYEFTTTKCYMNFSPQEVAIQGAIEIKPEPNNKYRVKDEIFYKK